MPAAAQVTGWPDNGIRMDYGTIYCYRVANAGAYEVVLGGDTRLSDARTPLAHNHVINDTTGLQTALNGKETAGAAAATMQAHLDASNPHPQYAGGGGGGDPVATDYYYTDGFLTSLVSAEGTLTFTYTDGLLTSQAGTGIYPSMTYIYTDGLLTHSEPV